MVHVTTDLTDDDISTIRIEEPTASTDDDATDTGDDDATDGGSDDDATDGDADQADS